jgi:hypothetical protein
MATQYIHEDHVTLGDELFFPSVMSCAAIIVLADGTLDHGGYHITIPSTQTELQAACQFIVNRLNGNISGVYVIGNYQRDNCPGVGPNGGLAKSLRNALNYNGNVWLLNSSSTWRNNRIAVRAENSLLIAGALELRIAAPGNWSSGGNANLSLVMREVRPSGNVVNPRIASRQTASFNGTGNPWHLGALEVA